MLTEAIDKNIFLFMKQSLIIGVLGISLFINYATIKKVNANDCVCVADVNCVVNICQDENSKPAKIEKNNQKNICIKNLWNLRELGDYKGFNEKTTKMNAFLRSSVTAFLDDSDVKELRDYGVRTVIDLRMDYEVLRFPSLMANVEGIKYYNIGIEYYDSTKSEEKIPISESYVNIIEQKEIIKKIFETISCAEKGTILFHCLAGRDRTGVISMILLSLAGVSQEDVIKDYLNTFENIRNMSAYKERVASGKEKPLPSDEQLSNELKEVIKYIKDKYGSFEEYLLNCALSGESIKSIKERII